MGPSSRLFVSPQVRSRESYLLQLLSELVPVSVLSLYPPYRPVDARGPHPTEHRIVPSWKWIWPAEQWIGDWTSSIPFTCSSALIRELRALRSKDHSPRWIWFSGASMAGVVEQAQALGYRVIVDQDRMPSSQVLRDASNHWAHWIRLPEAWRDLYYERRRCERAHAVVASSPLYATRARKLAPQARVRVVTPSVDLSSFESDRKPEGSRLVFCGDLEDPAQQQGVHWFSEEILPRLRAALRADTPEVLVAGPAAPQRFLEKLASDGIQHRTWDKNDPRAATLSMQHCLQEAMICFLPHRKRNAGFQFLLQAMAAGRPVVSTACGSEGLLFTPGREIWMDDEPDSFTSALIKLIRDPELRRSTVKLATEIVRRHYDRSSAREGLAELLREL